MIKPLYDRLVIVWAILVPVVDVGGVCLTVRGIPVGLGEKFPSEVPKWLSSKDNTLSSSFFSPLAANYPACLMGPLVGLSHIRISPQVSFYRRFGYPACSYLCVRVCVV